MEHHLQTILKINLIGKEIEVLDSSNKTLVRIKGKVIDETKNLIIIQDGQKLKKLLKSHLSLKIPFKERYYAVDGKLLIGRPEERLKKTKK